MLAWLAAAWPLLWHYGAGIAVVAGAIAAYVLLPNKWMKQAAIAVGVGTALWIVGYAMGDRDGRTYIQTRWDNAVAADLRAAASARSDAEAFVPPLTEEDRATDRAIVPHAKPCRVPDPNDRDCPKGGVRTLR